MGMKDANFGFISDHILLITLVGRLNCRSILQTALIFFEVVNFSLKLNRSKNLVKCLVSYFLDHYN